MSNRDEPPKGAGRVHVLGEAQPLIPPGRYLACLVQWNTYYYHRYPKVRLTFRILEQGEHFGTLICGHYRLESISGKPKKWGVINLRYGSRLARQLRRLYGTGVRPDRLSLRGLMDCYLRVEVRTVTEDSEQDELPACDHYSKVHKMLEIVEQDLLKEITA